MELLVFVVAWVAIGVATGILEARRGHWAKTWVLGAILGPLSIPLAVTARRREALVRPRPLRRGRALPGELHVLVGIDGSAAALTAAARVVELLGPRLGGVTLAAVLDYDTAQPHDDSDLYPGPWEEEEAARASLHAAGQELQARFGLTVSSVLLAGDPATALEAYAREQGSDLLVAGRRGRGLSKAVLGSCASHLAGRTRIPVLLVPEPSAGAQVPVGAADVAGRA